MIKNFLVLVSAEGCSFTQIVVRGQTASWCAWTTYHGRDSIVIDEDNMTNMIIKPRPPVVRLLPPPLTRRNDGKNETPQADFFYSLFYSVYAWTNGLIGCLFGGILVDRYGVRKSCVVFSILYLSGQTLFAAGSSMSFLSIKSQYWVMFLGRFVFGIGGGSITLVQNTISATYFFDGGLATAFGFTLTASRLGSVFNLLFTSEIVDATSVPFALWFGVVMCLIGCGFGAFFLHLDTKKERWLELQAMAESGTAAGRPVVKKVGLHLYGRIGNDVFRSVFGTSAGSAVHSASVRGTV